MELVLGVVSVIGSQGRRQRGGVEGGSIAEILKYLLTLQQQRFS